MRSIQIYATGAATANDVAHVTIPTAGRIKGAQVSLVIDGTADNTRSDIEVSKVPVSQINTNSAQDAFLHVSNYVNNSANGTTIGGVNVFFPLDVEVRAGEIIYMHAYCNAATGYVANVILFY